MASKLDKYELDIENNFQNQPSIKNTQQLEILRKSATQHQKSKKSITIRVANYDLEAIKLKASKMGLAYQTYINMLIHQEATKL